MSDPSAPPLVTLHHNPLAGSTNPAFVNETQPPSLDFRKSEVSLANAGLPIRDSTVELINFRNKYEINPKYATMLQKITNFTSIIVADDSGSMNELADPDVGHSLTRWDELKKSLEIIIEAHSVFNISCDVYFINRGFVRNVQVYSQLQPFLVPPPQGGTNLMNILNMIQRDHIGADMGRPLIIHILTDGHPTDGNGNENIRDVAQWMRLRPYPEKGILGVDVSEDYRGETRDVRNTRGRNYRFTFGDYIVKVLVGAIDPSIHNIDLPASGCILS
eukprot:gene11479-8167_t